MIFETKLDDSFPAAQVLLRDLSDFHIVVVTELKMSFEKLKSRIVADLDYKHFDNEKFSIRYSNLCLRKKSEMP